MIFCIRVYINLTLIRVCRVGHRTSQIPNGTPKSVHATGHARKDFWANLKHPSTRNLDIHALVQNAFHLYDALGGQIGAKAVPEAKDSDESNGNIDGHAPLLEGDNGHAEANMPKTCRKIVSEREYREQKKISNSHHLAQQWRKDLMTMWPRWRLHWTVSVCDWRNAQEHHSMLAQNLPN